MWAVEQLPQSAAPLYTASVRSTSARPQKGVKSQHFTIRLIPFCHNFGKNVKGSGRDLFQTTVPEYSHRISIFANQNTQNVVEDNIKISLILTFYVYEDRMTSSTFTYKGEESNIKLREIRNEKIHNFYFLSNVNGMIKSRKMRCVEHVVRTRDGQTKKREMHIGFRPGSVKEGNQLEGLRTGGRMILKWILRIDGCAP